MNFSLAKLTAGITTMMLAAIVVAGLVSVSVSNQNRVIMGVQSEGVTLSGMTKAETHDYFTKLAQKKLKAKAAILTYKDKTFELSPEDINLQANIDDATNTAYAIGREDSMLNNIIMQLKCAMVGQNIKLDGSFDEDKLTAKLTAIKNEIDQAPTNASAALNGNTIQKKPMKIGLSLDISPIEQKLAPDLKKLHLTPKIELSPNEAYPYIKDEDLAALDSILGSYSTDYTPSDRGDNITLAASKFQGVFLKPQAVISFNDIVGHRSYAAGYKNAGVIVDGEPAIDVGGGVCQVSSTLYNAVLLAGLTPTERSSHFLPSHYVPAGRDATVADDLLDFKFKNPLPHPVYIRVQNNGSTLTFFILGTRTDLNGETISLETTGDAKNPSLYRLWKKNGAVVNKEFMHTDHYD